MGDNLYYWCGAKRTILECNCCLFNLFGPYPRGSNGGSGSSRHDIMRDRILCRFDYYYGCVRRIRVNSKRYISRTSRGPDWHYAVRSADRSFPHRVLMRTRSQNPGLGISDFI